MTPQDFACLCAAARDWRGLAVGLAIILTAVLA